MRPLHHPRRGAINGALVDSRTGSDDAIYDARVEPGAAAISAISPVKYRYRFANE